MFVEQLTWSVPPGSRENCLELLKSLCRDMDASGGLISALTGTAAESPEKLCVLSFWKGWEDLTRFLAHPNLAPFTDEMSRRFRTRPKPQHYESVWQWPADAGESAKALNTWSIHEFVAGEEQITALFDSLRQTIPRHASDKGPAAAGLWMDENNPSHGALSLQWKGEAHADDAVIDAALLLAAVKAGTIEISKSVFKLHAYDPHLAGVHRPAY